MTPELAETLASDSGHFEMAANPAKMAEAQLVLTLEILRELRRLCQKINEDMPIEPVRVNVEGAVEVFNR